VTRRERTPYVPQLEVTLYSDGFRLFGGWLITPIVTSYNGGRPKAKILNGRLLQKSMGEEDLEVIIEALQDQQKALAEQTEKWLKKGQADDERDEVDDINEEMEEVKAATVAG